MRPAELSRGNSDSILARATASFQDTFSTGKPPVSVPRNFLRRVRKPAKPLGFLPVTRWYCACVTGNTPR
jgi:hypothetical protein